jgi:hypothetical protein
MKSSYVVGDRVRFVADTFSSARYGFGGYVVAVTTDRVTATIEVCTDGGRVLKFGEAQAARLLELESASADRADAYYSAREGW